MSKRTYSERTVSRFSSDPVMMCECDMEENAG